MEIVAYSPIAQTLALSKQKTFGEINMRRFSWLIFVSVCTFALPVHAQFQGFNVEEDAGGNTAVGANTLYSQQIDENNSECPSQGCGTLNTAVGASAMGNNVLGQENTAVGASTLVNNSSGIANTATGAFALQGNTTGQGNVADGFEALVLNEVGTYNTATGYQALYTNNGNYNVAFGSYALASLGNGTLNTGIGVNALEFLGTGDYNTAVGTDALLGSGSLTNDGFAGNSTGNANTAVGYGTLYSFTVGSYNAALGMYVLHGTTTGNYNTASGYEAMYDNTIGAQNSAYGLYALHGNSKGNFNTGLGGYALYTNTSGSSNVAIGYKAGFYPTAGTDNIHIGNLGAASDTGVIKVGTQGTQKATTIAGIYSTSPMTGGSVVVVNSAGLLGVQSVSSERFKSQIMPMDKNTARLEQLRPVSFHYRSDPHGPVQYGLVAEEVAKIYPELVTHDERGHVNGVRYDELAPMLLNEMKLQRHQFSDQLETQAAEIRGLKAAVLALQGSQHTD